MRASVRSITPLVLALSLAWGCVEEAGETGEEVDAGAMEADTATVGVEDERAAIDAANARFVERIGAGDVPGAMSVYTDDAMILPPDHPPVEGRPSIEEFWAGAVQSLGIASVDLESVELEIVGDTAYEVGRYSIHGAEGALDGGSYLVVWRRSGDGTWRWHRDIWNGDGIGTESPEGDPGAEEPAAI